MKTRSSSLFTDKQKKASSDNVPTIFKNLAKEKPEVIQLELKEVPKEVKKPFIPKISNKRNNTEELFNEIIDEFIEWEGFTGDVLEFIDEVVIEAKKQNKLESLTRTLFDIALFQTELIDIIRDLDIHAIKNPKKIFNTDLYEALKKELPHIFSIENGEEYMQIFEDIDLGLQ